MNDEKAPLGGPKGTTQTPPNKRACRDSHTQETVTKKGFVPTPNSLVVIVVTAWAPTSCPTAARPVHIFSLNFELTAFDEKR